MKITVTMAILLMLSGLQLAHGQTIADFEDLVLPPDSAAPGDASQQPFASGGVEFNRTWNADFDCCPGAWAVSNQTDLTTAGFANPYSAFVLPAGGGAEESATYAVASNGTQGAVQVTFPQASTVMGTYVANTTYTYLAVVEGNDAAGFVKGPFSDGDWFRLDFIGFDDQNQELGTVEFYLADYRAGGSEAISDWTWVDLTELGSEVSRLEFRLESTDVGDFGMNTPAYFAVDNLSYQVVPEPASMAWIALLFLALWPQRRFAAP